MSQKKTSPSEWYEVGELYNIGFRICPILFSQPINMLPVQSAVALQHSLNYLSIRKPGDPKEETARLCWVLAWRASQILCGYPVQTWKGAEAHEWSIHEVIGVSVKDDKAPISLQDYVVKTLILSGEAAGCVSEKLFSKRALVYLSPKMGFSKKPSDKQAWKIQKYPRLLSASDLLGLRWWGLLQPGHEYPPRYFDIKCTGSLLTYNRDIIRRRKDGTETNERRSLVSPGEGPSVSDGSDSPTVVREHGERVPDSEPCLL